MKVVLITLGILIFAVILTFGLFFQDHPQVKALLHIRQMLDSLQGTIEDPFKKGQLILESEEALGRGVGFLLNGDLGKALFELDEAIKLDSNNYRAYYNKGIVYRVGENFTAAETAYRTSIDLAPKFYASYNNLANLFLRMANTDSALFYINRAITANPDCTDYVDTKIDVLIARNELKEAKQLWEKAIETSKEHYGLLQKKEFMDALRKKQ